MDELFGDENENMNQSIESNEWLNESSIDNEMNDTNEKVMNRLKTTIEKSISPIRKPFDSDLSHQYFDGFDHDLSFNKSKTNRKYASLKKNYEFWPNIRSTPKTSKTRKSRKKSNRMAISLWDKAIDKNPELRQWIHSFNEDMKKVESSELSITQSSVSFTE